MKTSFNPDLTFSDVAQLAREHGCVSLESLGREFYDRTDCGVSTRFLTTEEGFHYECRDSRIVCDMPANQWPIRNVVGVKFTTIVEGSDAEFSCDPLYFPFTDEELAQAWDYLNDMAAAEWEACHEETED